MPDVTPDAEGAVMWKRSSFCSTQSCLEVRRSENGQWVWIRTDDPLLGSVPVTPDEWAAFVAGVKAGEFDYLGSGVPAPDLTVP